MHNRQRPSAEHSVKTKGFFPLLTLDDAGKTDRVCRRIARTEFTALARHLSQVTQSNGVTGKGGWVSGGGKNPFTPYNDQPKAFHDQTEYHQLSELISEARRAFHMVNGSRRAPWVTRLRSGTLAHVERNNPFGYLFIHHPPVRRGLLRRLLALRGLRSEKCRSVRRGR